MFSIIIPTFNAGDFIASTLQSVTDQSWQNYEIIVIDNCSSDNTIDTINTFNGSGRFPIQIFSSSDKGIYDAQNKGTAIAKNPWIIILGAGDRLHNSEVFTMLAAKLDPHADIFYGNILKFSERGPDFNSIQCPPKRISKRTLLRSRGICQQSLIVNKRVFRQTRFSESYKIAGDFDWILTCVENKVQFKYINETISDYSIDGISGANVGRLHSELKSVIKNHYPLLTSMFYSFYLDLSCLKHKIIKSLNHE